MEIQITKTAIKDIRKLDSTMRNRIFKAINNLPLEDEIEAIEQAKIDIDNGDVVNLSMVNW